MATQETFSKLEEEQMGPQYDLDAQGRLVNYCLQLVASDREAADAAKAPDGGPSDQQLPPLNPLPTSMSAAASAMASIHQDITNYLSATPASTVKYGDVQVHLGWKITKAADLGASMGEIKKFVKWKVDAHNKQVARDSGVVDVALSSEGESSGEGRRRFEGAAISKRKKNVGENISMGLEGGYAMGVENRKWAFWGLGAAVVAYFFAGTVVESVGDAIDDVVDYVEDIDADTFLHPLRTIVGTVVSFFGAIIQAVIAGPEAIISTSIAVAALLTSIDLQQFLTALLFPMTRIGPVSHPLYYVLLSAYALLFTWHLREEDLMIHEHLADSPLFSQLFAPGFVAYMCAHLLTSSLSPILGVDAMLLHSGEFLRVFGEDGFRAKLGLAGGQSPCGLAETCPMHYFGGEGAEVELAMKDDVGTAVTLVTRAMLVGVLVWGGLDRWWARREIRGARV
ncbi:uncharacterized protein H6S33_003830 [Morchella sextelata]|uniref:uncharacterized protein n=1 Tax=Morchella sextelata TaxID=1174677 RepID=UPI001D04859C|nr:uncharacterized protein H6S33_003830 [Morchella sextelata]KAH0606169.1 hypothetical protein H6S33_003830 [Morchella sextelata]